MAPYGTDRFLKKVRNTLITGIFIIIPIAGSLFIIAKLLQFVDGALPKIMGTHWFPGVGLFVTVGLIYCIGLLTKFWFGRKIIATGNSIISSIPFLNKIYLVLKQIIDTVTMDKKQMFNRTVLIEYPRKESYVIGFITSEHNALFSAKSGRKLLAVFIPTVPNPTSGFLLYIPEEDVVTLDISVEAGFKLIVSAGLIGTEKSPGSAETFPGTSLGWKWTDIFKRKPPKQNPADL